ncbi:MAG: sulfotransferase family 2 domain-containing protein [Arcobacter sp.]|nr:sulfotransferase family 2 domain-containing protein [Arcobacter sp.]
MSPLIEFLYSIKIGLKSFKESSPILIITPGKVGSTSVYKTLISQINNPVYHIHCLSKKGIENSVNTHLTSDRRSRPLHLIISNILRKKLNRYSGELYIITITREPISRAISTFFQNTEFYKNLIEDKQLIIDENRAEDLLKSQLSSNICLEAEEWYNTEIKGNFGINIFENKFDTTKKYVIVNNDRYKCLLLRMEDLNDVFPEAIKIFLNRNDSIILENSNIGESKFYANSYNNIKNRIKLPKNTMNQVVNSLFFKHFYKDFENKVRRKWS